MTDKTQTNLNWLLLAFFTVAIFMPNIVSAGGFEYESYLNKIMKSVSGPVAMFVGIVAMVGAAIMYAFNADNMSGGFKTFLGLTFILGIALNAATIITGMGASSSGALI